MIEPSTAAVEAAARALADAESSLPWESFDMEYVLDFRLRARAALSAAGPAMVADELEDIAAHYPADVFTPDGKTPDGIAGTAIREVLLRQAAFYRREQP